MARPLRIEFSNAIYHVMAGGNGRQAIFHADADYQRMTDGLAKTVARTGWQVYVFDACEASNEASDSAYKATHCD